jgi:hypothetical protein
MIRKWKAFFARFSASKCHFTTWQKKTFDRKIKGTLFENLLVFKILKLKWKKKGTQRLK